jgi:hypothetical protein
MSASKYVPLSLGQKHGNWETLIVPRGTRQQLMHAFTLNGVGICLYSRSHSSQKDLVDWIKTPETLLEIRSRLPASVVRSSSSSNLDYRELTNDASGGSACMGRGSLSSETGHPFVNQYLALSQQLTDEWKSLEEQAHKWSSTIDWQKTDPPPDRT